MLERDGKVLFAIDREGISKIGKEFKIKAGQFEVEIEVAPETSQLHLFLSAGSPCYIYGLKIVNEVKNEVAVQRLTGREKGKFHIFEADAEPAYILKTDYENSKKVIISGFWMPICDELVFQDLTDHLITEDERKVLDSYYEIEKELVRLKKVAKRYERLEKQYKHAMSELYTVSNDKRELQTAYDATVHSFFWRLTNPLRICSTGVKKLLRATPVTNMLLRILACIREKGVKFTIKKSIRRLLGQDAKENNGKILYYSISKGTDKAQRKTGFEHPFLYDIFAYVDEETSLKELSDLVHSVEVQTYDNWHLYLVEPESMQEKDELKKYKVSVEKESRISFLQEKAQNAADAMNLAFEQSKGQYKMIVEAKDILHPSALFECQSVLNQTKADLLYSDEASFQHLPEEPFDFHFKPDFSVVTLRGHNYLAHLTVVSAALWKKAGKLDGTLDEKSHYDWILRLTEHATRIYHMAKALYYNRESEGKVALPSSDDVKKMKAALENHLSRCELKGKVAALKKAGTFKVAYTIDEEPLISILIPNKDFINDLSTCIHSIMEKSTYHNFEIIIIENNSTEEETFAYYEELQKEYSQIKVVYWNGKFNYAGINNYGAQFAKGEYILLLNNDVEVITPNWLEEMLMYAQQKETGAVGVMLYYPDDTVQHAGVTIGVQGVGGHAHKEFKRGAEGYHDRMLIAQNLSCVTAACMMVRKNVFDQVEGLDERFEVAFNDVDFCLRIMAAGYGIIFTPFAELYHFESKSRGTDEAPEKRKRFVGEVMLFTQEWKTFLDQGDPYYNPNLTLDANDFSYKK